MKKQKKKPFDLRELIIVSVVFFILVFLLFMMKQPENILLSFDTELVDGEESLLIILDILEENKVKATFFVMGKYAVEYPQVVRRMQTDGHEVACHSFSHPNFRKISEEEKDLEINKCISAIENATGSRPFGFRAPYHKIDRETNKLLKDKGFMYDASHIENLGILFPNPKINEIHISSFILPLSDVICLHYLHMPSKLFFWMIKHESGKYVSVDFHPHHLIKHMGGFEDMLQYYKQKNIRFITHKEYVELK